MEKKKRFIDHTIVALVIALIVFVLGLIVTSVAFKLLFGDDTTPFNAFADMLATVIPAVVAMVVLKILYRKSYTSGLGFRGLIKGFKYVGIIFALTLFIFLVNFIGGARIPNDRNSILIALIASASAGIFEELMFRGIITSLLMRKCHKSVIGIFFAVIASAAIFGLSHLANVAAAGGLTTGILLQIGYATALGSVFGAAFVRSKNVWGCMVSHFVFDAGSFLFMNNSNGSSESLGQMLNQQTSTMEFVFDIALMVVCVGAMIYLLRPSKIAEVKTLWAPKEDREEVFNS